MDDVAITTYQPSANIQLSTALMGIEEKLLQVATANVDALGEDLTTAERHAMIVVEELRQIQAMDLAAVLLRGKLLKQIEEEALWTFHPGQYPTLEAMARDQGISIGQLSVIRDLNFVIFPYFEEMGVVVSDLWEQMGKSNMVELVPVLKALITGQEPATGTVRATVANILDDVAVTAHAAGQEMNEDQMRHQAIDNLLTDGINLTNRQLRQRLRPERTPALEPTILRDGENRIMVVEVSEEQWLMFKRKMGTYMDEIEADLPRDPRARQRQAATIPAIRNIMRLLEGE